MPDPFGCGHDSYADHNNGILRQFLDRFGFDYEFLASSDCYRSGRFDEALKAVLRHYDAIMGVMLPTLGEERRRTYSPVLPISPASGKVLQVPIEIVDAEAGLVAFEDEGERVEQSILSGGAKLQWKVDWAMRWVALGVDYEMSGKDLIDSVTQSSKIARILGARPPDGFNYEMFLDENGEKISKTKGNGVTIDEWLAYAPEESLAFYIYREPRKAKQLSFSVIPRAVDEYDQFLAAYPGAGMGQAPRQSGPPRPCRRGAGGADADQLRAAAQPGRGRLDRRQGSALGLRAALRARGLAGDPSGARQAARFRARLFPRLHRRFAAPPRADARWKRRRCAISTRGWRPCPRMPTPRRSSPRSTRSARRIRSRACATGSRRNMKPCSAPARGPRMGSFIALYGIDNSRKLIAEALAR